VPYALFAKAAGGHFVGELYVVVLLYLSGKIAGVEHGLIASLTDINAAAPWSDVTTLPVHLAGLMDRQILLLSFEPDYYKCCSIVQELQRRWI